MVSLKNKYKLALNMIVKDEEHVIKTTLESIHKYIDYYIITDTGSSDNTKKIIKEFFDSKNIKGEIHDVPWKNFGYNRTKALELCDGKCDYCWVIDADDIIVGDLVLPKVLNKDCYFLKYGRDFTYIEIKFLDLKQSGNIMEFFMNIQVVKKN